MLDLWKNWTAFSLCGWVCSGFEIDEGIETYRCMRASIESKHVRSAKPTIWNRPEIIYCALDDVEEMRRKSALTYRLQINPTIGQSWMKSFEGSQLLWPENKEWMTTKDTILIPSHWCHICAIELCCDSKFEVTWMLKIKRNANSECLRNKKWRTKNDEPCFIPSQQEASSQWRVVCEFWSIKVVCFWEA
jgi:hypothetical protein